MPKTTRPKRKPTITRPKQETNRKPVQQRNAAETGNKDISPGKVAETVKKYISPGKVAERWDTSRSSVDRIAKREKFTQFYPGAGSVRYLLKEVIDYENGRLT